MIKINDGGPAFAAIAVGATGDVYHQEGLSLRDYFAGQAMAALIQSTEPGAVGPTYEEFVRCTAQSAYEYADALLAERSKSQGQEP